MKRTRIFLAAAALAALVACSKEEATKTLTITFEDQTGQTTWKYLIDSPQYGGALIYSLSDYCWSACGISHSVKKADWGSLGAGWDSGAVISNYVENGTADYTRQLAVRGTEGKGGHGGSANFAVWTGHDWGSSDLARFTVEAGYTLKEMYVTNTSYGLSYCYSADGKCNIKDGEYVKVVLKGKTASGTDVTSEFYLVNGPSSIVKDWTKWDLGGLGEVSSFTFDVTGNIENSYGFAYPAYFAFDDLSVVMTMDAE